MHKFLWLLVLVFSFSASVMAQDTPAVEAAVGYSYWRAAGKAQINLNGWNASVTANINQWLGLEGEFGGVYESRTAFSTNLHSFMGGPRITYRKEQRTAPFFHALFGATRANKDFPGLTAGASETAFSSAIGGGLDVKITDRVAIRAGQLDWVVTKFESDAQANFRFTAGVVFRFGKR